MDRNSGLARVEGTQLFPPIESIVRCCCITILKSPVKGFSTYLCFLVHPSIELSPAHPSQLLLLHPHPHYTRRCCCDCWIVEKETLLVGIKPPAICPSPPPPRLSVVCSSHQENCCLGSLPGEFSTQWQTPQEGFWESKLTCGGCKEWRNQPTQLHWSSYLGERPHHWCQLGCEATSDTNMSSFGIKILNTHSTSHNWNKGGATEYFLNELHVLKGWLCSVLTQKDAAWK